MEDRVRSPIVAPMIGFMCERDNIKKALNICKDTKGKKPTAILRGQEKKLYGEEKTEYILIYHGKGDNYLLQVVVDDITINNQYYHKKDLIQVVIKVALECGYVFIKGSMEDIDNKIHR